MSKFDIFKSAVLKSNAMPFGAAKNTEVLAKTLSAVLEKEGHAETSYDVQKCLEQKAALGLQTKANEIEHTTNTGAGAELVPGSVLTTDFLDLTPTVNPLLQEFVGFHGRNMNKTEKVPVIGDVAFHQLMAEQTTGAFAIAQGLGTLPTDEVQIDQKQYFFSVDISEALLRFSVVDILAIVKNKLAKSAARTMIAAIINGDDTATANTNINSIDGTPAATDYYMGGVGLRETAFRASNTADLGTLGFDDFITLQNILGENAVPEDVLFIMGTAVKNKALGISEFLASYQNGLVSTAITGKLPEFLGTMYSVQRDLAKANTAGKVATGTPGNNTKGQLLCLHRAAVQYGFNGEYSIEVYRVPGKGLQVVGYYFMGYAIADSLVSSDPTVALGYNITV